MYVCMLVYACMYAHPHTYIHTYIQTYIHTYIHTYIQQGETSKASAADVSMHDVPTSTITATEKSDQNGGSDHEIVSETAVGMPSAINATVKRYVCMYVCMYEVMCNASVMVP
jgi:hypothetical protein